MTPLVIMAVALAITVYLVIFRDPSLHDTDDCE